MAQVHHTARYQKARKEWLAELPARPQCWLCLGYIDRTLPARSRMSLTADHEFEVANNPELACDPRYFHAAHLICNSSRSARGWTPEEFRKNSTLMLNEQISTHNPIDEPTQHISSFDLAISMNHKDTLDAVLDAVPHTAHDDAHTPIAHADNAQANAQSIATIQKESIHSFHPKRNSVRNDPRPPLNSRDWSCDHAGSQRNCVRCMDYQRRSSAAHSEWLSRHPECSY